MYPFVQFHHLAAKKMNGFLKIAGVKSIHSPIAAELSHAFAFPRAILFSLIPVVHHVP
jgi:hypothetical protein